MPALELQAVVWTHLLWVLAAVAVLESFDISLPRGDTLGVSGAIHVTALVLLGPGLAVIAAATGKSIALLIRSRSSKSGRPGIEFLALASGFAAAGFLQYEFQSAIQAGGWKTATIVVLIACTFLVVQLVVAQLLAASDARRSPVRTVIANLMRQSPLLLAQVSAALLAVLMYPSMQEWSLVLVVVLLLLMRQSYALLLDIRETYRMTVTVMVEAAESGDPVTRGHGERTAQIARAIGASSGMSSKELENLSYAALLHGIGCLGTSDAARRTTGRPSVVLEGVDSFAPVVQILRVFDESAAESDFTEESVLSAFSIALASDIDEMSHPGCQLHEPDSTRLSPRVSPHLKARAVAAALRLGYRTPQLA